MRMTGMRQKVLPVDCLSLVQQDSIWRYEDGISLLCSELEHCLYHLEEKGVISNISRTGNSGHLWDFLVISICIATNSFTNRINKLILNYQRASVTCDMLGGAKHTHTHTHTCDIKPPLISDNSRETSSRPHGSNYLTPLIKLSIITLGGVQIRNTIITSYCKYSSSKNSRTCRTKL
jgi:hypothetical protein